MKRYHSFEFKASCWVEFWVLRHFFANLANSNNVTDKRQMAPDLHAFSLALGQLKLIRCQVKSWNLFREPLRDGDDVVFWGTFNYIILGDSFHLLFKARITWQLMPARHPWVELRAFSSRLLKGNMLGLSPKCFWNFNDFIFTWNNGFSAIFYSSN